MDHPTAAAPTCSSSTSSAMATSLDLVQQIAPTRSSSTSSAMAMDVVQQILLRLPATSVVRFKSVCKDWHDLTLASYFVVDYARRRPRVSGFLVYEPSVLNGVILGSCNGLVIRTGPSKGRMQVYNPTTRQRRILPRRPSSHRAVALAFDPRQSASYSVLLLGYNPREIMVYSSSRRSSSRRSETESWQTFFFREPLIESLDAEHHCFANGLVYWLTSKGFLVSIDVEKRTMITTTAPTCLPTTDHPYERYSICYLGPSRGGRRLRVIRCNFPPYTIFLNPLTAVPALEVLELASDHSEWRLLHKVYIRDMYSELCRLDCWTSSVDFGTSSASFKKSLSAGILNSSCLLEDDEKEVDKVVLHLEDKVLAYDLGSRRFHVLRTDCNVRRPKVVPWTSTLAAP